MQAAAALFASCWVWEQGEGMAKDPTVIAALSRLVCRSPAQYLTEGLKQGSIQATYLHSHVSGISEHPSAFIRFSSLTLRWVGCSPSNGSRCMQGQHSYATPMYGGEPSGMLPQGEPSIAHSACQHRPRLEASRRHAIVQLQELVNAPACASLCVLGSGCALSLSATPWPCVLAVAVWQAHCTCRVIIGAHCWLNSKCVAEV